MKSLKAIGLAAMVAMAIAAFGATSAFATELYEVNNTLKKGAALTVTLGAGTSANLSSTAGTVLDTCKKSEVAGNITDVGSSGKPVVGAVTTLTFGECTEPVTVTELGTLEVQWIASTDDGKVYAKGFRVDVDAFTNPTNPCVYSAGATTLLGVLEGRTKGTEHALLGINAVVEKIGGPLLCPFSAKWVATYSVTSPTGLNVRDA